MRKHKCTTHGRFNILYILVVSSVGRCIADKLRTRLFRSTGDRLPRSERYDYVRLFAEFDSFAAADSDSWTSRVMSSSLDSILHALDWSISRVSCVGTSNNRLKDTKFSYLAASPTILEIFLIFLIIQVPRCNLWIEKFCFIFIWKRNRLMVACLAIFSTQTLTIFNLIELKLDFIANSFSNSAFFESKLRFIYREDFIVDRI